MKTLAATVRENGEGEQRWFCGGGLHTWKATEEETGGAFLIFEDSLDAGKVTPLHRHPDADETFYMLEGEIVLHVDGEERQLRDGDIAVIPGASRTHSTSPQRTRECFACRPLAVAGCSTASRVSPLCKANHRPPSTSTESARQQHEPAR